MSWDRLRPMLIVAVVVLLLLFVVLWFGQRRLIFLPDRSTPPVPPLTHAVTLTTSDDLRLTAWLVPPVGPDRHVAVLMAPGNGGNRGGRIEPARALAARGLTVLLLEYRGYGGNPGSPSEEGLARDARAATAFLREQGFGPDRTIYFGESLGCAVVTALATEEPPAGLVLRSPFASLSEVGSFHYPFLPVRFLLRDRFPVADQISTVRVPTTVIYGTADTVVPPEQSRTVAKRAAGPVTVVEVPRADHNDFALFQGAPVIDAVVATAHGVDAGGPG